MKTPLIQIIRLSLMASLLFPAGRLASQTEASFRKVIPLPDSTQPLTIKISLTTGRLGIQGSEDGQIVLEASPLGRSPLRPSRAGEQRLQSSESAQFESGLSLQQQDHVVNISLVPLAPPANWTMRIPSRARLELTSHASGDLRVEQVTGEIEANLVNGTLWLTNVAGAVVAHVVNGQIQADFAAVPPDKSMAFTTVNGNIQLAFPESLSARVKLQSTTGKVSCDFPIQPRRTVGSGSRPGETTPPRSFPGLPGQTLTGTINGPGPEITVKTVNGNIEIKKKNKV